MIAHATKLKAESALHFSDGVAVVLEISREGSDFIVDEVDVLDVPLVEPEVLPNGLFTDAIKLGNFKTERFVFHKVSRLLLSTTILAWHGLGIECDGMSEQIVKVRISLLGALFAVTILLWLPLSPLAAGVRDVGQGELMVAFLDVGQGDGIFIQTPDGVQVLIDGGPDGTVLRALSEVLPWGDRTLDMVVGTHPDKDHVAGLVDVLGRYKVAQVLRTENVSDTAASAAFDAAVATEGAAISYARAGQVWRLGAGATLTVLSPASDPREWESNAASIVALVRYGETEFLLTGDAPAGTEEYVVEYYGTALAAEVLKLGHHGSRTSTSEVLLEIVRPQYAIVSAGKDNDYGHPHREVVERVAATRATLVSTAEAGTIVFTSDGKQVRLLEGR